MGPSSSTKGVRGNSTSLINLSTPALYVSKLCKIYQRKSVLDDLSFSVPQGEYLGLIGGNGAGKTTLIKGILNLIELTTGEIKIYGRPHQNHHAREKIAFLPEKFTPPNYLKGIQFIRYFLELYQVPFHRQDIHHTLESLGFPIDILNSPISQYSKGISQILGLATCLMSQRSLLLLDEPMSGLDIKNRNLLKNCLNTLKKKRQTILFTTHLLSDLEYFCEKIMILDYGKAKFIGNTSDYLKQFSSLTLEEAYLKSTNQTKSLS